MMAGKAVLLNNHLKRFVGHAALYKLDPPLLDDDGGTREFVVVSAAILPFSGEGETYIFPATPDGKVSDWGELPGSMRGTLDHADALEGAGYEIVTP